MKFRIACVALALACPLMVAAPAAARPSKPMAPAVVSSKRVFMVSDSVGLGAIGAMPRAFPSDWQVAVVGKPAQFVEQLVTRYVNPLPASYFGDYAIVAGGYNYPYWDNNRFDRSIDQMVNALLAKGVKHIFWVTLREVKPQIYAGYNSLTSNYKLLYSLYPVANARIRTAMERHPQLSIVDWASNSEQFGLTYDAIHLNPAGAALYSTLAASAVLHNARIKPADTITEFTVAGVAGVPADALAVSLNITAVVPRKAGFLTAYPCGGALPTVSNLNFIPDQTVASTAVVPVGVDGKVCVYQSTASHVIVDVTGSFAADSGFIPIAPARAIDTRSGPPPAANVPIVVHLGAMPGAPAPPFTAVVNLTIASGNAATTATLYSCDGPIPAHPSRSIAPQRDQNLTMVSVTDSNGDVCVHVSQPAHVLVDLFGAFPLAADFHAIPAQRLLDTRGGYPLFAGSPVTKQIAGLGGVPGSPVPSGAVLTLTLVAPTGPGWATIYPCTTGQPNTSVINVVANKDQTNAVITALDAVGTVCLYTSTTSHALVDVSGWSGTAFVPLPPTRLVDTRNG